MSGSAVRLARKMGRRDGVTRDARLNRGGKRGLCGPRLLPLISLVWTVELQLSGQSILREEVSICLCVLLVILEEQASTGRCTVSNSWWWIMCEMMEMVARRVCRTGMRVQESC